MINTSLLTLCWRNEHKRTRIVSYPYQNAAQLLVDFFHDVEILLEFEREYEYEI